MFQKIGGAEGRPAWLQPWAASAAVAAHVAIAAGIASVPGRPYHPPQSVETATFLVIFQADRAPALPARLHAGPGTAVAALRSAGERGARSRPAGGPAPRRGEAPAGDGAALPRVVPVRPGDPTADLQGVLSLAAAFTGTADGARKA
ncbi:MAG TPA: hypothetical protein VFZ20_15715, partial [Longimicrobium sp.]